MSYEFHSMTMDQDGRFNVRHVITTTHPITGEKIIIDNHRQVLEPGDTTCVDPNDKARKSLETVLGDRKATLDATWTPEVIAKWQEEKAAIAERLASLFRAPDGA